MFSPPQTPRIPLRAGPNHNPPTPRVLPPRRRLFFFFFFLALGLFFFRSGQSCFASWERAHPGDRLRSANSSLETGAERRGRGPRSWGPSPSRPRGSSASAEMSPTGDVELSAAPVGTRRNAKKKPGATSNSPVLWTAGGWQERHVQQVCVFLVHTHPGSTVSERGSSIRGGSAAKMATDGTAGFGILYV